MTESLRRNTYVLKDLSTLKSKKFHKETHLEDNNAFSYTFPVYKDGKTTLLECRLIINEDTGIVYIDVFNISGVVYSAFYSDCYYENIVLKKVNKAIISKLKKLGVEKVDN